jgi:acyl-CoA thioester hydrolase
MLYLTMVSESKKFSITIKVELQHLDALKHVNNVVYVQWMQDIAAMHWQTFASPQLQHEILWIVRRHEIDYYNQAFLDDNLLVFTWTGEYTNVTWKRHYEIMRADDNKKIICATSIWIPLDSKTQKPRRVDGDMVKLFTGSN